MGTRAYRIDPHHHVIPTFYFFELEKLVITEAFGFPFPQWSPRDSLAVMDTNTIASVVSLISMPGKIIREVDGRARDLEHSQAWVQVSNTKGEEAQGWLKPPESYHFTAVAEVRSVETALPGLRGY